MKKTVLAITALAVALAASCGGKGDTPKTRGADTADTLLADTSETVPADTAALDHAVKPVIGAFTDKRDGKKYRTTTIGAQTWMAENLNYEPHDSLKPYTWDESKCYENSPDSCAKYGRLYNWYDAMNACPTGWHLPTDAEWDTLFTAVGGDVGTKLKASTGWNNEGVAPAGTDDYGFSAMPGGRGYPDGHFLHTGNIGEWWSATLHESNAWGREVRGYVYSEDESNSTAGVNLYLLGFMLSVRCVRNNTPPPVIKTFTDSRDGKKYRSVKIGAQTWMAENMNYETDSSACYKNNPSRCDKYGRLYMWADAMTVCPEGWHLPTDGEWTTLTDYVGDSLIAGVKLKSSTSWYGSKNVLVGTDDYGFSAMPGGRGRRGRPFHEIGESGCWWSATEAESGVGFIEYDVGGNFVRVSGVLYRYMHYSSRLVGRSGENRQYMFSVRCVQDGGQP